MSCWGWKCSVILRERRPEVYNIRNEGDNVVSEPRISGFDDEEQSLPPYHTNCKFIRSSSVAKVDRFPTEDEEEEGGRDFGQTGWNLTPRWERLRCSREHQYFHERYGFQSTCNSMETSFFVLSTSFCIVSTAPDGALLPDRSSTCLGRVDLFLLCCQDRNVSLGPAPRLPQPPAMSPLPPQQGHSFSSDSSLTSVSI